MHYIMVRLPFCFSLWIFEHNTAVTIPKTVTVATHSATKEAVVAMKTPEEWEQRSTPAGDNVSCDIGRTDREQIRSRFNNNDCRTFWPRRPLSTVCMRSICIYTYILYNYMYNYTYILYIHMYILYISIYICMYIRPDGFVHCVQCWKLVTTGMYVDRRNYWSRSQQEYIQWNKTFVTSHLCFVYNWWRSTDQNILFHWMYSCCDLLQ